MEKVVLKRKVEQELLCWKNNERGRMAALVVGARRVGKSFVVEEFAKKEYKSYILIDFAQTTDQVREIFLNDSADLDNFFLILQQLTGKKLYERESVIIFDEVQLFPRARELIKYLVADGRYDYIETGSLMSIRENTKGILVPSEEYEIEMHPLDFEEFLTATGKSEVYEGIREFYAKQIPLGQALHRKYMNLFRQYVIVGGMPQAVARFIEDKDFTSVERVKRSVLKLYRDDTQKRGGKNGLKITQIYDHIPAQLSHQNKRFVLSEISSAARFREYEEAVVWLSESKIVNLCFDTTEPTVGLATRVDVSNFKCFQGDTGLLVSQVFDEADLSKEEIYAKLLLGNLEFNNGMVMENVVAQMLTAAGHKLYYYSDTTEKVEVDFLLTKNSITSRHNILPVEVKSGNKYVMRSLEKIQKKYHQQVGTSYVLHDGDLRVDKERKTVYLPLYMAGLL